MVEPITKPTYTEEQILKASYPDPEQPLLTSKIPVKTMDSKVGRVYYARDCKEEDREYIYSPTTILSNTLNKGLGFDMWLGNATSYKDAMDYARERAFLGTMTHAMIMWLLW